MSEENFRHDLSRLWAKVIIHDAQVMSDPITHMNRMIQHCAGLLEVLEKVEYALSPDMVFDVAHEMNINQRNINGEALIRCNKALAILHAYKR
jgi:hypothetical protein